MSALQSAGSWSGSSIKIETTDEGWFRELMVKGRSCNDPFEFSGRQWLLRESYHSRRAFSEPAFKGTLVFDELIPVARAP